ncbi:hypothetical protein EBR96_03330 [bacterium]|nr:hypothetical protein [bacterium]
MLSKISFWKLALIFSVAFVFFAGILYWNLIRSLEASARLAELEKKNGAASGNTVTPNATQIELAHLVFINQCATCHGSNAAGGTGPSLIRPEWTFDDENVAYIIRRISEGSEAKGMPPFAGRLRHDDIVRMAVYIEGLNEADRERKGKR